MAMSFYFFLLRLLGKSLDKLVVRYKDYSERKKKFVVYTFFLAFALRPMIDKGGFGSIIALLLGYYQVVFVAAAFWYFFGDALSGRIKLSDEKVETAAKPLAVSSNTEKAKNEILAALRSVQKQTRASNPKPQKPAAYTPPARPKYTGPTQANVVQTRHRQDDVVVRRK